jgi:hypothetical protein
MAGTKNIPLSIFFELTFLLIITGFFRVKTETHKNRSKYLIAFWLSKYLTAEDAEIKRGER